MAFTKHSPIPAEEIVKRIMEKKENKQPLTFEDVRNIKNHLSSFTPEQTAVIQDILKSETKKKLKSISPKQGWNL
jgi:hypothetical protein